MDIEEARTWFASSAAVRLIGDIDGDTDEALAAFERTISRMGPYPASVQQDYRRAASTLTSAQDAFNAAVNAITLGRARDGRQAAAAYRAFVAALLRLQALNARNAAHVEAEVARLLAAVFTAGSRVMSSRIRRETRGMLRDLERLEARLSRARRVLATTSAIATVNLAVNLVGGVLGYLRRFERAAAALQTGGRTLTIALELTLEPGGPSGAEVAYEGINVVAEVEGELARGVDALNSAAGLILDLIADVSAVVEAYSDLQTAERDLRDATRTFRAYMRHVASATSELTLAKRLADGAIRNARARARAFRESPGDYRELERAIADIR